MQMLKNWNPEQIPEKEDIKVRLSAARTRLYELQMALKEHKCCLKAGELPEKEVP